jgi:very-short-patch-repair endonuclease
MEFKHIECGQIYTATLNNFRQGTRCPYCKRESTGELHTELALKHLKLKYEKQKTFPKLKGIRSLRFDFYLPDLNTAIEYDGLQHLAESHKWHGNRTIVNDEIKNKFCEDNNITLIRIPHTKRTIQAIAKFIQDERSTTTS